MEAGWRRYRAWLIEQGYIDPEPPPHLGAADMTAPTAAPTIHCTVCQLMIEWSQEKQGMVDIGGATYCADLRPHRPDQPPQPFHRWALNEDPGAPNAHQTSTGRPDHCVACGVVRWPLTVVAQMRAAGPCQNPGRRAVPTKPREDQE